MVFFADIAAQEAVNKAPEVAQSASEGLPMAAVPLFHVFGLPVTNSSFVSVLVAAILIIVSRVAMNDASLRPGKLQNFVEWLLESLQGMLQNILGHQLSEKTSWFFATIFIFILVSNWLGLVPGVGTIGWGHPGEHGGFEVTKPIFRGANADVNMTLGLSLIFFGLWMIWAFQANGIGGLIHHIFGAKGGQKGVIGAILAVVFVAVGCIEILSILIRPVSLTFRLYGNIYGGENMMEKMMNLVPALSWLIPLPVYFFELLVGLVQALVFFLLTAVFTAMICRHDDSSNKESVHH